MTDRRVLRRSLAVAGAVLVLAGLVPVLPSQAAEKGPIKVEKVEFGGWKNNLRIANGDAELIITLDVGPRILSYKLEGGKNVLNVVPDQLGTSGETKWIPRGGHRLWTAPEDTTRTYAPDNVPVSYEEKGPGTVVVRPPADTKYGIQKEMEISLAPKGSHVTIHHRITNIGTQPTDLATWCLTVMAPHGMEIIPMPPGHPHPGPPENAKGPADFWPDRLFVAWPFTDFTDSRWHLGQKFITLKYDSSKTSTKLGMALKTGWVAYLNAGTLFIKRIDYKAGAVYPDFGCNFETYTDKDMVEIESLGPLVHLAPGQAAQSDEHWDLTTVAGTVSSEADIERLIVPKVQGHH